MDQLPKLEELGFEKLDNKYLQVSLIGNFIFWFFLFIVIISLSFTVLSAYYPWNVVALSAWLLFTGLSTIWTWLGFHYKGYVLRNQDITYRSGLLWRDVTSVPFIRIQHCAVNQGPLERLFQLANLRIYTAGGQNSDMSIHGLTPDQAHRLKDYILEQSQLAHDA